MRSVILSAVIGALLAGAGCASSPNADRTAPRREPAPTVAALQPPVDTSMSQVGWIRGFWIRRDGSEITEEHWTAPVGGLMLGVARTIVDGKAVFFEYLRIERRGDSLYYVAQPMGGKATSFQLTSAEPRRVVFENAQHDFPQRIIYWLSDDGHLHARIEGVQQAQPASAEWEWERVR